jgi:hypothetical protein
VADTAVVMHGKRPTSLEMRWGNHVHPPKSKHIPLATPSSAESATTEKIIFIVGYYLLYFFVKEKNEWTDH